MKLKPASRWAQALHGEDLYPLAAIGLWCMEKFLAVKRSGEPSAEQGLETFALMFSPLRAYA